jgi:hypothetical protein
VRLNKIKNKYLVLDILCYAHRTSHSFSQSLHRTSKTFRNFSSSFIVYLYFRVNPWREHLVLDKYGNSFPLDPGMTDKDLDFYIYSNEELRAALGIATEHSHLVTININLFAWDNYNNHISKECLDMIKILKHVEVNINSDYKQWHYLIPFSH